MTVMTADEVKARWRAWSETELGGPPERLDEAASAALEAAAAGLDSVAVAKAARDAALRYDAQASAGRSTTVSQDSLRSQWHAWADQAIRGSPVQIDAAVDAAIATVTRGGSSSEAVTAALAAAGAHSATSGGQAKGLLYDRQGRPLGPFASLSLATLWLCFVNGLALMALYTGSVFYSRLGSQPGVMAASIFAGIVIVTIMVRSWLLFFQVLGVGRSSLVQLAALLIVGFLVTMVLKAMPPGIGHNEVRQINPSPEKPPFVIPASPFLPEPKP